jgi:FAD/FMN-containing dehydrogenase
MTNTAAAVRALRERIVGDVFVRGDPDYERFRRGWDLSIDQYPALVLVPREVSDIAAGIRTATEFGFGVAAQSTGHGVLYPADDHLLIVTSRLKGVDVDVGARTARVQAGVLWREVLEAIAPHGLAAPLGSSPDVGVVGYMLGGGIGWLSRRYGFGADGMRGIDLVTADGVIRHASPTENPDLFWGLRGGGSNFGVVTAMEFELYPVPTVYGGNLIYAAEHARDVVRFYRDWIEQIPDELTSWLAIVKFPPLPEVPEAFRGKTLVLLMGAFAGKAVDGESWLRPWLDWRAPIDNTFHEMPFSEVGTIAHDPVEPSALFGSSEMLDDLTDAAIDTFVAQATDPSSPISLNVLRHVGGAIARVPTEATAIANRDAKLYLLAAGPTPTPEATVAMKTAVERYRSALAPHVRGGVWMNFMSGNGAGAEARMREFYSPETHERLLALKAKYDPNDVFRFGYQLRRRAR